MDMNPIRMTGNADHSRSTRSPLVIAVGILIAIACLYVAQSVLIPVALALLLSFLLAPVVNGLEWIGLGRVVSVIIVVVLTFLFLAGIGWIVTTQVTTLAGELPKYESNIKRKISDVRDMTKGGKFEEVQKTVEEIKEEIQKTDEAKPARREVVVQSGRSFPFLPSAIVIGPLFERLAGAGLVIILVVFMLVRREDMRNRFIRFVGRGRMTVTTKALEDAGERISRYLLMQGIINSLYGLGVALGLYLIGLPYAVLWGFVGAFLRFIPYVGPWIAAIMPSALSLAVFDGWIWPLVVMGLFVAIELFTNMVLETLLWGESAGVSEVALLISVAFWTWLWGPIGLLLATPLTVCLVVIGKYVPQMEFITILMSDETVLERDVVYYQRLLAMDRDEAIGALEEYLKPDRSERVYDEVLIPALNHARLDREEGSLTDEEEQFIFQTTREIVENLDSQVTASAADDSQATIDKKAARKIRILGYPAQDEADEISLLMLGRLLASRGYEIEVTSAEALASEVASAARDQNVSLICIGGLAPGGLAQTRYLCKRLRAAQLPDLKIVVGRWGFRREVDGTRKSLLSAGADQIATSLLEARDHITNLARLVSDASVESAAKRKAL
jgi:predicted PurR-regulated permease PerM/methylmalonyl-CoA mutase cobalamin-binding subunit